MTTKTTSLHPRNPHQGRYPLEKLSKASPELQRFITQTPAGEPTVDFSNSLAVQALNAALLASYYQVKFWQIPPGYLCPPVPGRADYLHYAADLVAELCKTDGDIPQGKSIRMLDIGCGANCIYPILATRNFGWQVVGSDIDSTALNIASTIVQANPVLKGKIQLRQQHQSKQMLPGIVQSDEYFDLLVCNPPFYRSAAEAAAVNQQKWQKLGITNQGRNFAGTEQELWCEGGELAFISTLITESQHYAQQVGWFTTLVSQQKHHKPLLLQLKQAGVAEVRQIKMHQGQKTSLLLAWRYAH